MEDFSETMAKAQVSLVLKVITNYKGGNITARQAIDQIHENCND